MFSMKNGYYLARENTKNMHENCYRNGIETLKQWETERNRRNLSNCSIFLSANTPINNKQMSYTIAETNERNNVKLVAVPSKWIQNGYLYWPINWSKSALRRCLLNANSLPPFQTCQKIPCKIRRKNIESYKIAEAHMKILVTNYDSSTNESYTTKIPPFNSDDERKRDSSGDRNSSSTTLEQAFFSDEDTIKTISVSPQISLSQMEITEDPNVKSLDNSNVMYLLRRILVNQEKFMEKQDKMEKSLDHLVKLFEKKSSKRSNKPNELSFQFEKISKIKDLVLFDELLENKEYENNLIENLKSICGENTYPGKGDNVAYTLVDFIFDRNLMTLVSWTGANLLPKPKHEFRQHCRIIEFFHKLVKLSDPSYTLESTKLFLHKKVIHNSARRANTKSQRVSRTKNRKLFKNVQSPFKP